MKFNLEERLIEFAVSSLEITERMPDTKGSHHLAGQLARSGTSPALQYGEAQAAESRRDFIHKMKISLKELRESMICLQIIRRKKYIQEDMMLLAIAEANELISIFVKSIQTASKNIKTEIASK
jgi:four helix bundle protein